jgi:ribosomal protein S18 acetylase RimI-like enzyme
MRIAFYEPDQLETVVDLFHEMSVHYNGLNASARSVVKHNLVENILADHSSVRLVIAAERDRAVALAAIAVLYPAARERGQLFMKEIFVSSSHRGCGIGTSLMRFVAKHAIANNCIRLDWTVDRDNERALDFYRRVGARPAADKIYFRVSGEDLVRFAAAESDNSNVG